MPDKKPVSSKKKAVKKANPMAKLLSEMSQNYTPPSKKAFESVEDKWVKIHVRLMNWRALNFDLRVLESTNLHVIEQKIAERHGGSIQQIKIYHDNVAPNCEVTAKDFDKSLRQIYGFDEMGPHYAKKKHQPVEQEATTADDADSQPPAQQPQQSQSTEPEVASSARPHDMFNIDGELDYDYECVLYYDFAHFESDCPLLKTSPRLKEALNDSDKKNKNKTYVP
ncbi:cytidylate kinase [Acrasis kona]|uniref:Cytidylate kinase n=1 Tax=Acrasis kona TaxID=1008807 RepID=A0AAW2ZTV8_9EUKA